MDTLGNLLVLVVTPANAEERAQVGELAKQVQQTPACSERQRLLTLLHFYAHTSESRLERCVRGNPHRPWPVVIQPQEVICVLRYDGPYQTCLQNMPLIGQTIQGYTAYGVKVDHAEMEEGDGSTGSLTMTLRNPNTDVNTLQGASGSAAPAQQTGQAGDSQPSLHWQPYRRRIESHPLCGTNSAAGGTGTAISQDGHILQSNYKAVDGGWTYQQYQSPIQADLTEYDEPQPVLTLRTQWYTKPTLYGQDNFAADTPPSDQGLLSPNAPVGGGQWVWVRGGDNLERANNRWDFQQSWTGFRPGTDLTLHNLLSGGSDGGSGGGGP